MPKTIYFVNKIVLRTYGVHIDYVMTESGISCFELRLNILKLQGILKLYNKSILIWLLRIEP